ncbi:MAG: AAA family ATPase [Proteobacteria bacterium]|nr:AAA family ATPase [Pseudomonadota bacterium]
MTYITRDLDQYLDTYFSGNAPKALIIAGVVGCGKTTTVTRFLERASKNQSVFSYTGDDVQFRNRLTVDSMAIVNDVRSASQGSAIVFVDEVQKTDAVFDALKICFDAGISFIVSGSNPSYLANNARTRLQRRADFITMAPFGMPEILSDQGFFNLETCRKDFLNIIDKNAEVWVPDLKLTLTPEIQRLCRRYLQMGGLPSAFFDLNDDNAIVQIRTTVERGFEVMDQDNQNIADIIRIYRAKAHSKEFAYQGIMQRTGIRKRDTINVVINALLAHGYLHVKKPTFLDQDRRSYLCVYSYCDPGIVTYLSGESRLDLQDEGFRVEGAIHNRLEFLRQLIPLKSELAYYKPFVVQPNAKTKFLPGEIDFIYMRGKRAIPLEVKSSTNSGAVDTKNVENFIQKYKSPYGIILYGGVPQAQKDKKLIFWPYWLV